ncbi:expressed unknown protein [Seminavis robusta]|uniref:Uncharacterized protein n=1 Tax=Seminavis robusta TaxID=568900 RepID=A0A9N8H607_9STRA|nr:expressed unknown protein [Seminavis robusta]|eukprot:Sro157_g071210.1 n/a (286) ;mRNA; r:56247-57210
MGFRILRFVSVTTLLVSPIAAQFGIPMKKKSSFQDLNEQAIQDQQGGGGAGAADMENMAKMMENVDMEQMQKLWQDALSDPEAMKQMGAMGDKFGEAMNELSKMTPEQLAAQMQEAMQMLTDDSMADKIIEQKDEVLKSLEQTGMVDAEELAKFKADPGYFESKMRESFGQMKGIFNDPDKIKEAMESMHKTADFAMHDLAKMFTEGLDSDEKIEEARQEVLNHPEMLNNPMMAGMFGTDEFKEVINDPKKWRESIKEGRKSFQEAGRKMEEEIGRRPGAGVGEL